MNNILNATITGKNSYLTWFVWKIKTVAAKVELETEQNKIVKLQTHGLSYFLGKYLVIVIFKISLFINHHLVR